LDKAEVVECSTETSHRIRFEEAEILAKISRYINRLIKEAIEIRPCWNNINREEDFKLSKHGTSPPEYEGTPTYMG
jgi:hypothetical protein